LKVNEAFVHSLTVLGERRAFLADPANQTSLPAKDLMPMLERLHLKALQRIRNHLLTRMHALKKPNTNIQIKQKLLVKAQPLYTFMASQQDQEVQSMQRRMPYHLLLPRSFSSTAPTALYDGSTRTNLHNLFYSRKPQCI
jgi:hypothetical protein